MRQVLSSEPSHPDCPLPLRHHPRPRQTLPHLILVALIRRVQRERDHELGEAAAAFGAGPEGAEEALELAGEGGAYSEPQPALPVPSTVAPQLPASPAVPIPSAGWDCECGSTNRGGAKHCKACGKHSPSTKRKCEHCEAVNERDARFCDECGTDMGTLDSASTSRDT